jgi:hypothetical protein
MRGRDHAIKGEYIGTNGVHHKNILMHRLAWMLYRLRCRDEEGKRVSNLIYQFYIDTMSHITDVTFQSDEMSSIASLSYKENIHFIRKVFSSAYDPINKIFINLASTLVDCCLLAKMFWKKSDVSIIHSGLAHTTNYVIFFNKYLGIKESFRVDNSLSMRLKAPKNLDIYAIEHCDDIPGLRCVMDERLPNIINFAEMRQFLIDKDILETAQYTIIDMHEKNKRRTNEDRS